MSETVRSVERAIDILTCFTLVTPYLTVPEISNETGLTKSTVFRILASLESKGMVEKVLDTHQFKLGLRLLALGNVVQSSLELRNISMPILRSLSEQTQETVNINVIQGEHRVCIDRIDGNQELRKVSEVGKLLPLHKGATGKLLLAFSSQDKIIEVLKKQKNILTEEEMNKLKLELFEIRERGYAVSYNERLEGTSSISAPIADYSKEVVASITISGPSIRLTEEKINLFITEILVASEKISRDLGYVEDAKKSMA